MSVPTSVTPRPIKAIIFDCFGVLLGNPYKQRLAALQQENPERGEQMRATFHAYDKGIISTDEATRYVADILRITPEAVQAEQAAGEVRNEELIAYIESLPKAFPLAMLSNISSRERLDIRFLPGQLDRLFSVVVASGDVGYTKPDPEIYTLTAERLGVLPSECVMIDDIREYCDGAEAVGMQSIQFISTQQCISDLNTLIDRGH